MGFRKFNRTCNRFQSRTVFSQHWWALLYCIPHVLIPQGLYLWTNLQHKERNVDIRLKTSNICEYNQERATPPSLQEEPEPNKTTWRYTGSNYRTLDPFMCLNEQYIRPPTHLQEQFQVLKWLWMFKVRFHGANQTPWSKTLFWLHGLGHGH